MAFSYVEGYRDGCAAIHGRAGGCSLGGELAGLHLLDDMVEVGVHVGILRRVELALKRREVFDALLVYRLGSGFWCRRVASLRLRGRTVVGCEQSE